MTWSRLFYMGILYDSLPAPYHNHGGGEEVLVLAAWRGRLKTMRFLVEEMGADVGPRAPLASVL
jgi:hypothetical protein